MTEKEISLNEALQIAVEKQNLGDLEGAEKVYNAVLKKQEDNVDALHLLGLVKHQKGEHKKAREFIEKAISLKPEIAIFHGNLGMVYDSLSEEEKAINEFEKAIELDSNYEGAWRAYYNLGIYYSEKENFEKAIEFYNKCLERTEGFGDAEWNKSLLLLLLGRYKEGFEHYDSRFEKEESIDSRDFLKKRWNGEDLSGKKLLLVSEQGAGDNVCFIRFIKEIKEKYENCEIVLECQKELKNLFSSLEEIDEIIVKEKGNIPEIEYDYYIHLMSLPRIFETTLENIPLKSKYLSFDKGNAEEFKDLFDKDNKSEKLKIGIVWAGNPNQENDENRSMDFEDISDLGKIEGIEVYSLQKGKEVDFSGTGIIDLDDKIEDYKDTEEIIENLDLIISVDTSVAHLSGALGKKTWILLTKIPDWRYGLFGDKCEWYDSIKLFRQKEKGNWKEVIEEVKEELEKIV